MDIEIQRVSKRFGSFQALRDVDLKIGAGEMVALLGPSGCGKTSLLRIIAGLESPDAGKVLFGGEDSTGLHARDRRVGFVFQHYALFPHMTVRDNIAFGLRIKPRGQRPGAAAIRSKVDTLLERVQLSGLADRYPAQLSGGQRQRVALARALAVEPRVLLLDEPFGALDASVRKELRRWLRRLHDELRVASVFVTHDQEEALEVADRVVVMNAGRIEQDGTPRELWDRPATPFVCGFLGDVNRIDGRAGNGVWQAPGASLPAPGFESADERDAVAYVRPHEIDLQPYAASGEGMPVTLDHAYLAGSGAYLALSTRGGTLLEAHLPEDEYRRLDPRPGDLLLARPRHGRVFAVQAGRRAG